MGCKENKPKWITFLRSYQLSTSRIQIIKNFIILSICIIVIKTTKLLLFTQTIILHTNPIIFSQALHFHDLVPWYFSTSKPDKGSWNSIKEQNVSLWPEEENSDRIKNQLMFVPLVEPQRVLKILMYNGLPFVKDRKTGSVAFAGCPVKNCFISTNRSEAQNSDAILFRNVIEIPDFPKPKNQIWIYYTMESPYIARVKSYSNLINWTATYRIDSDVVAPYGKWFYYDKTITEYSGPLRDFTQNKTKMVAWFVSNCKASNKRREYALELQKYIQVDIYGSCGTLSCPRSTEKTCFQMLAHDYKFYLAFENANCKDYITEKLFLNGLGNNIIPIVMGTRLQDYKRSAPKNSYIHVEEFSTPKHLAEYLKVLAENADLYNSYFKWKGTGEVVKPYFLCRLCTMLHSDPPRKSYKNLSQWWNTGRTCTDRFWRDTKYSLK